MNLNPSKSSLRLGSLGQSSLPASGAAPSELPSPMGAPMATGAIGGHFDRSSETSDASSNELIAELMADFRASDTDSAESPEMVAAGIGEDLARRSPEPQAADALFGAAADMAFASGGAAASVDCEAEAHLAPQVEGQRESESDKSVAPSGASFATQDAGEREQGQRAAVDERSAASERLTERLASFEQASSGEHLNESRLGNFADVDQQVVASADRPRQAQGEPHAARAALAADALPASSSTSLPFASFAVALPRVAVQRVTLAREAEAAPEASDSAPEGAADSADAAALETARLEHEELIRSIVAKADQAAARMHTPQGEKGSYFERAKTLESLGIFETRERFLAYMTFCMEKNINPDDPGTVLCELIGINKALHDQTTAHLLQLHEQTVALLRKEDARTGQGVAKQGRLVLGAMADQSEAIVGALHSLFSAFLAADSERLGAAHEALAKTVDKAEQASLDITTAMDESLDHSRRELARQSDAERAMFAGNIRKLTDHSVIDFGKEVASTMNHGFAKIDSVVQKVMAMVNAAATKVGSSLETLDALGKKQATVAKSEIRREIEALEKQAVGNIVAAAQQAIAQINAGAMQAANGFEQMMDARIQAQAAKLDRAVSSIVNKTIKEGAKWIGGMTIAVMVVYKVLSYIH
ncbi:hypothetical protein LA345_12990 [Burkholderia vietnamiensis]|nr:hypothetical protein [Burkholderia vietnamiensis]